jgi:hypothetical protein
MTPYIDYCYLTVEIAYAIRSACYDAMPLMYNEAEARYVDACNAAQAIHEMHTGDEKERYYGVRSVEEYFCGSDCKPDRSGGDVRYRRGNWCLVVNNAASRIVAA